MHRARRNARARLLSLQSPGSQRCYRLIEDHYSRSGGPSEAVSQNSPGRLKIFSVSLRACCFGTTEGPPRVQIMLHITCLHVRVPAAPWGQDKRPGSGAGRAATKLPDSGVGISAESQCCCQQSCIDLPRPRSP